MNEIEAQLLRKNLESTSRALHLLSGRLIMLNAQVGAQEEVILMLAEKLGVNAEELRKHLRTIQISFAEQHLTEIGETNPKGVEQMDPEGILAAMITRLKEGHP